MTEGVLGASATTRREFLRRTGIAVAALAAAPLLLRDTAGLAPAGINAFEFVFGAEVQVVLATGSAAGYFDVIVRRDGQEVELFRDVHAGRLGALESEHFTTRRITPPG